MLGRKVHRGLQEDTGEKGEQGDPGGPNGNKRDIVISWNI